MALVSSGFGASSPNGGVGGAPVTAEIAGSPNQTAGLPGTAPGAGGSGAARGSQPISSTKYFMTGRGGASGGYSKSVYYYNVTPGHPAWGASLAYAAGIAGAGGVGSNGGVAGGNGTAGRVRFTWT